MSVKEKGKKNHRHRPTASDFTFAHGSFLQAQHFGRQTVFLDACKRDRKDARSGLFRERKFTVQWRRLSRNKIWTADTSDDVPVVLFENSVQQYKKNRQVWPFGHHPYEISLFGQIWDYFRFQWEHTRPYKTVTLIILMAASKPLQNLAVGFIANAIETDPKGVPVWLYFAPFLIHGIERTMYWWYEINVPLNSQRYQLRCMLLTQRVQLSDAHPVARKWPARRFTGLLRDVDELVNGVWGTCLEMIEELVTVIWTTALCLSNLSKTIYSQDTPIPTIDYGIYAVLFLGLGCLSMVLPFLWFRLFVVKFQECEAMVRDGQALYLSAASHAVTVDPVLPSNDMALQPNDLEAPPNPYFTSNEDKRTKAPGIMTTTGKQAFRVFGLTTFRSFFLRLAWETNYSLIMQAIGAIIAYVLLTAESFGESFNLTSTLIVLLSLKDFLTISHKLLNQLTVMSRGCLVLGDVAELLNSQSDCTADNDEPSMKISQHPLIDASSVDLEHGEVLGGEDGEESEIPESVLITDNLVVNEEESSDFISEEGQLSHDLEEDTCSKI